MGEGVTVGDYSNKHNNGKRGRFSLHPSLLIQGDMGMGRPHSLLNVYASAERQTCDYDGYWEGNRQNHHVMNFQTTETKLVAVYSSQDEDT